MSVAGKAPRRRRWRQVLARLAWALLGGGFALALRALLGWFGLMAPLPPSLGLPGDARELFILVTASLVVGGLGTLVVMVGVVGLLLLAALAVFVLGRRRWLKPVPRPGDQDWPWPVPSAATVHADAARRTATPRGPSEKNRV